jgi:acetyl-CoA carboxylase biotin carboxyl carrier protein
MSKKPTSKASSSSSRSTGSGFYLAEMERMLKLMEDHDLAEMEVEQGDRRVVFRTKDAYSAAPSVVHAASLPAAHLGAPSSAAKTLTSEAAQTGHAGRGATAEKQILSPFVGVFYCAATPGADPFVRVGQSIKKGDVLCIVEAMKLMNEIEAEWPGRISKVLVENGQAVEFGEPLFSVDVG